MEVGKDGLTRKLMTARVVADQEQCTVYINNLLNLSYRTHFMAHTHTHTGSCSCNGLQNCG